MRSQNSLPISHNESSIGFVGGGQLAQMLALEAHSLGLKPFVLTSNPKDPALLVCPEFILGSPEDHRSIKRLLAKVKYVTFESEFYDMKIWKKYENNSNFTIYPKPSLLEQLQNRWTQKQLLKTHFIPTSPFHFIETKEDLQALLKNSKQIRWVLKKVKGGYDGYGTFYINNSINTKRYSLFNDINSIPLNHGAFIAEHYIPFQRELSLIFARSHDGSIVHFPLVESYQRNSRCDWVKGPVTHHLEKNLILKLTRFLNQLQYVGVIAFELFDTGNELFVNEIAPRVHNTGHFSQDALFESQFLLHIKSGLGKTLNPPQLLSPFFCMKNIIGTGKKSFPQAHMLSTKGKIHWYGKDENRLGRKMGHINYLGSKSHEHLLRTAQKDLKNYEK